MALQAPYEQSPDSGREETPATPQAGLESSSGEKELAVSGWSKASASRTTEQVNSIPHRANRSTSRRQKEQIIPLY